MPWKIKSALNCKHALADQFKGFRTASTVRISHSIMAWCWNSGFDGSPQCLVPGTGSALQSGFVPMGLHPMVCRWWAPLSEDRLHRAPGQLQDIWDLVLAPGGVTTLRRKSQPAHTSHAAWLRLAIPDGTWHGGNSTDSSTAHQTRQIRV